jgi:hypothetical protein
MERGIGVKEIFWYGLGINRDYNLSKVLTVLYSVHSI